MDTIEPSTAAQHQNAERPDKSPIDWSVALGEHQNWLRSVLAARLGDRHAVDEVWQDVAVAAVSSKAPPTDLGRVAPWLYKVAIRRALMFRRGKGRQRRRMQSYAQQRAVDVAEERDPLDWLLSSERQRLVRQAVGSLHHRDQELLLLKYLQDWSYAQIAEHLGVSSSAIESRLHRARQRLRDELAKNRITSPTA